MKTCHISHLEQFHTNVLTPLLDPKIPSTRAVFIITENQQEDVKRLKALLAPRGIIISFYLIEKKLSTQALLEKYEDIFTSELSKHSDENICFNATCGSRRKTLSAFEVARNLGIATYIIEPDFDSLHWLYPTEKQNSHLADKLKLADYFKAHDIRLGEVQNSTGVRPEIRSLGEKWVNEPIFFNRALGQLNFLAYSADNAELKSKNLDRSMLNDPALMMLIDDLESIQYATLKNDALYFTNEACRFFSNGGWLEEFVFGTMISLKKEIGTLQDCLQGVELYRGKTSAEVKNELDVLALNDNKLHIVECKTKKFEAVEGNEVIHKLDSLADLLGGNNGRALLVSFKKIRVSEAIRAKELDITFIGPAELPHFKTHIKNWLMTV